MYTSRRLVKGHGPLESLRVMNVVSDALVEVVRGAMQARQFGFMIAKGGITSHELAFKGLAARRTRVLGAGSGRRAGVAARPGVCRSGTALRRIPRQRGRGRHIARRGGDVECDKAVLDIVESKCCTDGIVRSGSFSDFWHPEARTTNLEIIFVHFLGNGRVCSNCSSDSGRAEAYTANGKVASAPRMMRKRLWSSTPEAFACVCTGQIRRPAATPRPLSETPVRSGRIP